MRELNRQQISEVSGASHGGYWHNDDLFPTVVRNAGWGALGGAIGGPMYALYGGAVGAMRGFQVYYSDY